MHVQALSPGSQLRSPPPSAPCPRYLSASGYLPPSVRPFFVALPKDRAAGGGIGPASSSGEWRKAIQARWVGGWEEWQSTLQ